MKQSLFFIEVERQNEHLNLTLHLLTISKLALNFLGVNREFLVGRHINTAVGSYPLHHRFNRLSGSMDRVVQQT